MDAHAVDDAAVDAVMTASRTLIAVAALSLGTAAEETTIAQYRALVVIASRGPQRLVDLAEALAVGPSTTGRTCDRLARKGLVRRHRTRADRRAVLVSLTAAGRQVGDEAAGRRRDLIAGILRVLPASQQHAVGDALAAFAAAAGEVSERAWPPIQPAALAIAGPPAARGKGNRAGGEQAEGSGRR